MHIYLYDCVCICACVCVCAYKIKIHFVFISTCNYLLKAEGQTSLRAECHLHGNFSTNL